MPLTIPIIEKEKKLYAIIYHPNKDTIDNNHALLQMPKYELAEILKSKRKAFFRKITI